VARATLELVTGPMFSGKTDVLIDRYEASGPVVPTVAVKPARDTRHPPGRITSHAGRSVPATSLVDPSELSAFADRAELVLVDEVQFFDERLIAATESLRRRGVAVVAVGLDLDFRRKPFPTTAALLEAASVVRRLAAVCTRCGGLATFTQRVVDGGPAPLAGPVLLVGDRGLYEPRCRRCWDEERASSPAAAAVRRSP
jgi:thymidine kinase